MKLFWGNSWLSTWTNLHHYGPVLSNINTSLLETYGDCNPYYDIISMEGGGQWRLSNSEKGAPVGGGEWTSISFLNGPWVAPYLLKVWPNMSFPSRIGEDVTVQEFITPERSWDTRRLLNTVGQEVTRAMLDPSTTWGVG